MCNVKKGASSLIAIIVIIVLAGIIAVTISQRRTQNIEAVNKVVTSEAFLLS